ncbi:succinate dehydrogenase assembly factor 4, mitochondrial [Dromaius novaehollandiae]|uniref:Succinate dehydrogenase assembly factor 4, mitochondrial n=2 Tax=Dromaius novaehollandiae TaxID=8790 RepID=A0A8C4JBF7_DRONO|nr:succinate dehydrogenase assembly factor 4, mitochondrial [Dromaius novaehollandiae]
MSLSVFLGHLQEAGCAVGAAFFKNLLLAAVHRSKGQRGGGCVYRQLSYASPSHAERLLPALGGGRCPARNSVYRRRPKSPQQELAGRAGAVGRAQWPRAVAHAQCVRQGGAEMGAAMALQLLHGAPRTARSSLLCSSLRSTSSNAEGRSEPVKQSLKKPKLPVGRFDEPEESNIESEPLEKFPDGINPTTKERGGPKGPEPTRYGDWERKGRCIDF